MKEEKKKTKEGVKKKDREKENKSQYWPRGAPKHAETAENEKA